MQEEPSSLQPPRLHTWETQGRDRSTSLMMCPAALALGMHGPTAPQNMFPRRNMFPIGTSTRLHGVPCHPAWGDRQQASRQGRHSSAPRGALPEHPVPAPHGVPPHPPASRSVPRGVPRVSPWMCHGCASQPYTKVSCGGQGGCRMWLPPCQWGQRAPSRVGTGTVVGGPARTPSCWWT